MAKLTKNQKFALEKIEKGRLYTLSEAAALVKDITTSKFDASVDIDVRLGIDPRKSNQMVRGVVTLPKGTGKTVRVGVFARGDKDEEAKAAGAEPKKAKAEKPAAEPVVEEVVEATPVVDAVEETVVETAAETVEAVEATEAEAAAVETVEADAAETPAEESEDAEKKD